jgi:phage shock protein PspC (stress-responsive transcriptional regulator)
MTKKRVVGGGESCAGEAERYEAAFARVRLVRAWIAAAAAMVAMLYAYVALLERVVK